MPINEKINHMLHKPRDEKEVQRWLFSLTPLGVAFAFFFLLLLPMEIEHKDMIMVIGLAAGFAGLQSYWVFRGWQKNHLSTVLLGVVGLSVIAAVVWLYVSLV